MTAQDAYRAAPDAALFRLNGTVPREPSIDNWFGSQPQQLFGAARAWFDVMRSCGDEVRECMHDGCPVACLGDVPFAYVNVFTAHVNVGFFQGASLPDPTHLLQGSGKHMRHVKVKPGTPLNEPALHELILTAYCDIKDRVERG